MGLETNLEKTKALVRTPGYIWGEWSVGPLVRLLISGDRACRGDLEGMRNGGELSTQAECDIT